jgi:methyl-accepting chemotaxis protein
MTEVAKANKRMEKGVKKIADNWEDFNDIMTDSTATAEDISTILPEVNEGLQDVLNLSDE